MVLLAVLLLLLGQVWWSRVRSGVGKRRLLSYFVWGGGLTHFPSQVGGTGKNRERERENERRGEEKRILTTSMHSSIITLTGDLIVQTAQNV